MSQADKQINELDPQLLSIGKLFEGEARYTVPIYQRNYAWQAEQIEQMLSDIQDALKGRKESYFLGNLIVTPFQLSDGFDAAPENYEVIDGQQRLTTLYLLLSLLGRTTHLGRLQYESRPRATAALEHIARDASYPAPTPLAEQHREDAGIRQGYKLIEQYIEQHIEERTKQNNEHSVKNNEEKKESFKQEFSDFIMENVMIVRAILPTKTDFNRYFEIMNTRGQQLQQVDIVKARLMAPLESKDERDCFALIWNACADMDSYVQMTLTPKNTEFREKAFGDDWSFVKVKDFDALLKFHKPPNIEQSREASFDKPLNLADAIKAYSRIDVVENQEEEDRARFRSIITFPAFLLHVLNIVRKDIATEDSATEDSATEDEGQLDDKVLVKQFKKFLHGQNQHEPRALAKRFAFELLRCRNLFDSYVIKREYTDSNDEEGEWSLQIMFKGDKGVAYRNTYSTYKQEQEDGNIDEAIQKLLMLESMLRVTYTSPRTMHWITRLLKLLIEKQQDSQIIDESILIGELRNYAREKVSIAFFKDEVPQGFSIERIVFTYLDYLLWEKNPKDNPYFRFTFRNSIEHFYPRNPADGKNAPHHVSKDKLDSFGNLALVRTSDNSRFGNLLPKSKIDTYPEIIEQSLKLKLMATAQQWGDQEVDNHYNDMLARLKGDLLKK